MKERDCWLLVEARWLERRYGQFRASVGVAPQHVAIRTKRVLRAGRSRWLLVSNEDDGGIASDTGRVGVGMCFFSFSFLLMILVCFFFDVKVLSLLS
jgi:hypothetical protein